MTTFILRRNFNRNQIIARVAAFLEALGDRCDWRAGEAADWPFDDDAGADRGVAVVQ